MVLEWARRDWLLAPRKSQNKFTFGVEIKFVSAFWSPRARLVLKTLGIYHKHTLPPTRQYLGLIIKVTWRCIVA